MVENFRFESDYLIPKLVAEIGCNHKGSVEIAKQMILAAKNCGADVAKFQKRTPKELLTPVQYNTPYESENSYGRTYGEHREILEFNLETHRELKRFAEENSIEYSTSVWDMTSAKEIVSIAPIAIKIPSACNNHIEMLEYLRDEYTGEIHISTGMSTEKEIEHAVDIFSKCPERVILYNCVSGYPVAFEDVYILEIARLREKFQDTGRVGAIGFSGHHNGIAIDILAPLLGASVIERHFTLDRTWKGSDHAASLEPQGFAKLVRDIHHCKQVWQSKPTEMLSVELLQREKLKYRSH